MHKAKLLVHTMCQEFLARDKIMWRASFQEKGKGEGYQASFRAGTVNIVGESPLGAAYGLSQLKAGLTSGHLMECLGEIHPAFSLRPLWLEEVPHNLMSEHFCRRLIELGYNSVIINGEQTGDFTAQSSFLHGYGLNLIVCANQVKQGADYLLWKSQHDQPDFNAASDLTHAEKLEKEMRQLEKSLPKGTGLIYFLPFLEYVEPEKQAQWLYRLSLVAGPHTILAFSNVAGEPTADDRPPHPFWDRLRLLADRCTTPLLPILNSGSVKQGEGLWPTLPVDTMDRCFAQMIHHNFVGVAGLARRLPPSYGLLHCALWIAGQRLWRHQSTHQLAKTWALAYRSDWNFSRDLNSLKRLRDIAVELNGLTTSIRKGQTLTISLDECRAIAEGIGGQLQRNQMALGGQVGTLTTLADYFRYFYRDARRMILFFLQEYHAPLAKMLAGGDSHESFWTQMGEGQGHQEKVKITFYQEPHLNAQDQRMVAVYRENAE